MEAPSGAPPGNDAGTQSGAQTRSGWRQWRGARDVAGAVVGSVLGVLPHLLHHVSLFAGAIVITGATGNVVFATIVLLLSIPLLRRLYRRFQSWRAPAVAVAVFAAVFTFSAVVLGPAINGTPNEAVQPSPPAGSPQSPQREEPPAGADHGAHHGD